LTLIFTPNIYIQNFLKLFFFNILTKHRYANGKVYGSESDYGSEYGSGQGKNGELQHENGGVGGRGGEQSDIGTYQSQNYQQSTLGRNRH